MSKASKVLSIFAVGLAVGYFINSDKRDEYIRAVRDKVRKWRDKNSSSQEVLARRYYLSDDPIDEIAR